MKKTLSIPGLPQYLVMFLFAASVASCRNQSGIDRIWAVDDGEKIRRDDITNPLATSPENSVWSQNEISIFGGRNEIIAFQIIIQADKSGASGINVSVSDLVNGTSVIPGSDTGPADPYDYRGRYVELFTEHYLNMEKRSPPLWFFSDSAAPSAYFAGWVPDCLIPFSAPAGKGGAPFSIEPGMNQGVWVDILIPAGALAGVYKGHATITVSGREHKNIPVALKVYDFVLPDSTHLKNMFGYDPEYIAKRHNLARGSDDYYKLELKYQQMAHRHRFDLVTGVKNLNDMSRFYKKYYTGEAYSEESGYSGPGRKTGNTTFSIGYGGDFPDEYGGSVSKMNKRDWWAGSDAWENWFEQNLPGVARHKYLFPDEPDWKGPKGKLGTGSMDTIKMQAVWTHTNPGPGKRIPTFVTNTVKPVLSGYVDFWSISAEEWNLNLTPEVVASERAKGHQFGIYNGFRPGMGAVVSDADAVEFRVMPWIAWKYNIDQYFYWSTTFWTDKNVFTNPLTYEDRINGDGTFLYPGEDSMFPEENRGLSGPLSSIRAKNWRRGVQDFEYLWLAGKAGFRKELNSIVDRCVPTGVWEAKNQKGVSWSEHGYKFEEYRRELAELLSTGSGQSPDRLLLKNYRPVSIYNVPVTHVEKPAYPVIDMHSHNYARTDREIKEWIRNMDACGIAKSVVLTEASGQLFDSIYRLYAKYPDRFEVWCGFDYSGYDKPGYGPAAVKELERCFREGARGVGEEGDKGLGLFFNPVKAWGMHFDDPRMKPLFEKCAELDMPVSIHVADPIWMYEKMDSTNDGLMNAQEWRIDMTKPGIIGLDKLVTTLENAVRDNPRTTFIACHFANLNHDIDKLGSLFDKYPNLYADISARYAESAPVPRKMTAFYEKYRDRLLYGTDMGYDTSMYRVTFRILETEDEHFYEIGLFGYHWSLYGFGLPKEVLKKVYHDNAARILE